MPEYLPNGEHKVSPETYRANVVLHQSYYPVEPESGSTDFRGVLAVLRRHLWLIAGFTLLGLGLGYYLVQRKVPLYSATATVRIVEHRVTLAGAIEAPVGRADPLLSQLVVLQGRGFAGELVDRQGLRLLEDSVGGRTIFKEVSVDLPPANTGKLLLTLEETGVVTRWEDRDGSMLSGRAPYGTPAEIGGISFVARGPAPGRSRVTFTVIPREYAIDLVLKSLGASLRQGTDAVDLRYVSTDPAVAQLVINSAAEVFQSVNARSMNQQAVRRRTFLEDQLHQAESRLLRAQKDLSDFRQREQVYSSGARLQTEQANLARLDLEGEGLSADRRLYQNLLALLTAPDRSDRGIELRAIISSPQIATNPIVSQMVEELQSLAERRDSLTLGRFALTTIHPEVEHVDTLIAAMDSQLIGAIRGHLRSLDMRLDAVNDQREGSVADLTTLPDAESEEVRLIREIGAAEKTADQLRVEYETARIAEAVEAGQVEIVSLASGAVPLGGTSIPLFMRGILLGLILGCAVALGMEVLNTSLRRADEIESILRLPSLAIIPNLTIIRKNGLLRPGADVSNFWEKRKSGMDDSPGLEYVNGRKVQDARHVIPPDSPAAEAFRTLRTNLLFSSGIQHRRVLLVTSAGPGEGKTTTAANLAIALAQQGMRVLLVDADLRRPRVHALLGTRRGPGLSDLLLQRTDVLAELCMHSTMTPGLTVLPAGEVTDIPAELVGGSRMESSLKCFAAQFDKVVIDAAPVLAASESTALASRADGVLVVVRAGSTNRDVAREALRRLNIVGAEVLGVVINDPKEIVAQYGVETYRYAMQESTE